MKKKILISVALSFLVNFAVYALSKDSIIPHRCGRGERPENTIDSIKYCTENLKVKIIEIDIQITKDDEVVLYHPKDLSSNTNGKGEISSKNFQEIMPLDAAYNFSCKDQKPCKFEKHTIPKLEDVLMLFKDTKFIVDLKFSSSDEKKVQHYVEVIKKLIDKINAWDRIIFYSTSDLHLNYLKLICPNAKYFFSRESTLSNLLCDEKDVKNDNLHQDIKNVNFLGFELSRMFQLKETLTVGDNIYNLKISPWSKEKIAYIRKKFPNAKIIAFGINDKESFEQAHDIGFDYVFSDNPELLMSYSNK